MTSRSQQWSSLSKTTYCASKPKSDDDRPVYTLNWRGKSRKAKFEMHLKNLKRWSRR